MHVSSGACRVIRSGAEVLGDCEPLRWVLGTQPPVVWKSSKFYFTLLNFSHLLSPPLLSFPNCPLLPKLVLGIKCKDCADKASTELYTLIVKPSLVYAVQLSIFFYAQSLIFFPRLNFAINHLAMCAIGTISKKTCQGLVRWLSG